MNEKHDIKDAKKVLDEYMENFLETFCKEMVKQAQINLQANGHVKTGKLKDSIKWKKVGPLKYEVEASEFYSGFLEYGTKNHEIFPVVAKALHWTSNGKDFFSKGHVVSGIKPSPFMEPAFLETKRKSEENLI